MAVAPKPLPHAGLSIHLLSGLAPDVPLRWLSTISNANSLPPPVTRALFSLLLRTCSPSEALAAQTALLHVQNLPQPSPAACLGFPADASPETIHAVVHDLLLSAARGDTLLLPGPALTLYADAGPDADEYSNPTPDPRVSHAITQHSLALIRAKNLACAIVVFAHAFDEPSSRSVLLNLASHNMSRFLAPLLDHLPDNVAFLPNQLGEAVHLFYAKFAAVATDHMRQDFATRLVCSLMRLASVDPAGICPYMHGVADAQIRLNACRMCLVQRFGVKDTNVATPLGVDNVIPYLKITPQSHRYNSAVPALLSSLLVDWYHIAGDESFQFKTNRDVQTARITRTLCASRDRAGSFGATQRDVNAFHTTLLVIGSKIMQCNS